ncbi:MAG: DUF3943 domain-containing protein [Planctomycetota bacterium]
MAFEFLLNQFDRNVIDADDYGSNFSTFKDNLRHGWVIDQDPFGVNQIEHPYSGALYHGFARSAGLGYWESLAYGFLGSALWETAGETLPPSMNDQITTSIGGSFFGEALFRTANWFLEDGEQPGFARELGAAVICPPVGLNRLAFGNRFGDIFPSNQPAVFARIGLGASAYTVPSDAAASSLDHQQKAIADFAMDYGLPGQPGYHYTRPFDYFHFEGAVASDPDNVIDHLNARGLLLGEEYDAGNDYRGVWGLYGSYDYLSPGIFRLAATSLSLGTTGQCWLARTLALQGTALGGVGFGAAGTVANDLNDRDYHYGGTPQAQCQLRLILDDAAMLDLTGRDFYVIGIGSDDRGGSESVAQAQIALTVRLWGRHALALGYVASWRDAQYSNEPDRQQSLGAISLTYTFLGASHFSPVEWRPATGNSIPIAATAGGRGRRVIRAATSTLQVEILHTAGAPARARAAGRARGARAASPRAPVPSRPSARC